MYNLLPVAVVQEFIEKHKPKPRPARTGPPAFSGRRDNSGAARYVEAAVRNIISEVGAAQEGQRHDALFKGSRALWSLKSSEWVPDNLRADIDPEELLMAVAWAPSDVRVIQDAERYASPRSEPMSRAPKEVVPLVECRLHSTSGTTPAGEDGVEVPPPRAAYRPTPDEVEELRTLFPAPV